MTKEQKKAAKRSFIEFLIGSTIAVVIAYLMNH